MASMKLKGRVFFRGRSCRVGKKGGSLEQWSFKSLKGIGRLG